MNRLLARRWRALALCAVALAVCVSAAVAGAAIINDDPDVHINAGVKPPALSEEDEQALLALDNSLESNRTAGDVPLSGAAAGQLRGAAARQAAQARKAARKAAPAGPTTFGGAWDGIGPNPIAQVTRGSGTFAAMSGRIGALAIRKDGRFILGAAQGGIWTSDDEGESWVPRTDDQPSLSMGALAIAPTDDSLVYAGTGEGALSGDSYFGNGVMKSIDGGTHWASVSGDYFVGVSISRLVVDPTNKNHLYAAVLRGRGGSRRVSPPLHSRFGIWESKDGGVNWVVLREVPAENGATDLEIDPLNPKVLYASFWSDKIYKSTNGGQTWAPIMTGLPVADYAAEQTRFSIAISHPVGAPQATLYAGFGYDGNPSRVWKSVDSGGHWAVTSDGTGDDSVLDYCAEQCFYDNVIEVDPTNPSVVFAGGQFNYGIGSGGIFRSDDGGTSWRNLGWDQHPDFHALTFDPSDTSNVLVGSDGGVWWSDDRGGRASASSPLDEVTWVNLNGGVGPFSGAVVYRTGLQISQFSSIATNPNAPVAFPGRVWGGTQDNGTVRHSSNPANPVWFDFASGDGGQALVDPSDWHYVYGTYYGISPYRYSDGGNVFTNQAIYGGLNRADRSDFYIPFALNQNRPSQLFLGTYRVYRTDNAKAGTAGDVYWKTISDDLTSGCTGTAPNGARTCAVSAVGVGGGTAAYAGTLDGYVWVSPDAQTSDTPAWTRIGANKLPNRPVSAIAVDRSNYRTAYIAYGGFSKSTPGRWGHVYKTTDGGVSFDDISQGLPDVPVNSIVVDASFPDTLYAGTDVGPFVTYDGGGTWQFMGGTSFPVVAIWQLDMDPSHRTMVAGTHGRGAFAMKDTVAAPALVLSKVAADIPVGPTSQLAYTVTLRNIGNAAATSIKVTDPVPANTSWVSGGAEAGGAVTWTIPTLAPGASVDLSLTVSIDGALKKKVSAIVNDGLKAVAAAGFSATGSPVITSLADPYKVAISPAAQTGAAHAGNSVTYAYKVTNLGYVPDTYALSATGTTVPTFDDCSAAHNPITSTGLLVAGASRNVCVKVSVPLAAADGSADTSTIKATSAGDPTISATATAKTIAVTAKTLLVDNDDNAPDVQGTYKAALDAAGQTYSTWDLKVDKVFPIGYLQAFSNIVWFSGNSYPAPIGPYEAQLALFLDGGGRLFMSGQDILDQAAGLTLFVKNYLHIDWDDAAQNDKPTASVAGVAGNPVTGVPTTIGTVLLDHTVLGAAYEDRITPNGGALPAFRDDLGFVDALTYSGTYKVVFLAFPFEAYGTTADKNNLMSRVFTFFGP